MEECSVCLINGSATSTETLKNLVLPGIGKFTIVDGAVVSEADLGNNFFVDESFLGSSRAACVTQLLQELNEHVQGAYVSEDISQVLESRPDFLNTFGIVIATQLPAKELQQVAAICANRLIPLIVVHSYGFMGYLRVVLNEHQVVEAHPAHEVPDLRVLAPPAELRAFIASRFGSFEALTSAQFAHVPYVVFLVKAVEQWSRANGGGRPKTYQHKKEIRVILEGYRRAGMQATQNIDEAIGAVNTALTLPTPKASLAALFAKARARVSELAAEAHAGSPTLHDSAVSPTQRRQQLAFWVMCAAVSSFVESDGNGLLPVVGTIPDMTSDTSTYVSLQAIYQQQAAADLQAVQAHAAHICSLEALPADLVSPDALKLFCKNANAVEVLDYSTLAGECESERSRAALAAAMGDDASAGALYLLLRGAQAYRAERSNWPGQGEDVEEDLPAFKQFVNNVAKELNLSNGGSAISDDLMLEFCRWGASEMHSVASVMGGIASQEAIKAVCHQYVPLNNTFIFNGLNGTTSVLTL